MREKRGRRATIEQASLEVVGHPAEPLPPPPIPILPHLVPVVGGEAPVLPHLGVVVRRGARLLVHIEQMRRVPRVHRVVVDADGQVALEHHPLLRRVLGHVQQLRVHVCTC